MKITFGKDPMIAATASVSCFPRTCIFRKGLTNRKAYVPPSDVALRIERIAAPLCDDGEHWGDLQLTDPELKYKVRRSLLIFVQCAYTIVIHVAESSFVGAQCFSRASVAATVPAIWRCEIMQCYSPNHHCAHDLHVVGVDVKM